MFITVNDRYQHTALLMSLASIHNFSTQDVLARSVENPPTSTAAALEPIPQAYEAASW
jgi:hypothetical protein